MNFLSVLHTGNLKPRGDRGVAKHMPSLLNSSMIGFGSQLFLNTPGLSRQALATPTCQPWAAGIVAAPVPASVPWEWGIHGDHGVQSGSQGPRWVFARTLTPLRGQLWSLLSSHCRGRVCGACTSHTVLTWPASTWLVPSCYCTKFQCLGPSRNHMVNPNADTLFKIMSLY